LCTYAYVTKDRELSPLDVVLAEADLLIIGAPHSAYADVATDKPVVDVWGLRQAGVRV